AADVLHDDVPGTVVLDEVVDLDSVGVLHLGQEPAFGHGGQGRGGVAGAEQTLEDHPSVGDPGVGRQVDPAHAAVRQAARDPVLTADQVAGAQLGDERVAGAAGWAEPGPPGGPAAAAAPDRRAARAAVPLVLGHLRVGQHA